MYKISLHARDDTSVTADLAYTQMSPLGRKGVFSSEQFPDQFLIYQRNSVLSADSNVQGSEKKLMGTKIQAPFKRSYANRNCCEAIFALYPSSVKPTHLQGI